MNKLFYRAMTVDSIAVDEKERTATVSFSSESPVTRRYYGDEILLHGEKNIDLEYLNTVGSVLRKHGGDMVDIVGPVKKAWTEDRIGKAIIGFDDDENGNLAMQKIKSGSLRGISCGYSITRGIRLDDEQDAWVDPETKREYSGPAVIALEWRPHEITLTPIPADHSVGFGRSLVENIQFDNITRSLLEGNKMDEKEIKKLIETTVKEAVRNMSQAPTKEDIEGMVRSIVKEEATPRIQVDRDTLADLSSRASAVSDECKSRVFDMALEGRSHVEMLTFIGDQAVKGSDAGFKRSSGDDKHDKTDDTQFRKISDIPDDLFAGAFRS